MEHYFPLLILRFFVFTSVLPTALLIVGAADDSKTSCSSFEIDNCQHKSVFCPKAIQDVKTGELSEITQIKLQDGVHCDSTVKSLLQWADKRGIAVDGRCASPSCLAGQRICQLNGDANFNCDNQHVRRRRSVDVNEESNVTNTKPSGPGGIPVLPCDFESNLCQWYQLSDSDFKWTRRQGHTPSSNTGPSGDHTTGSGYYIYIETSVPRQLNDKARLVSPTLRPVGKNQTCKLTFYVNMYGDHIGKLNILQAPVIGQDTVKKAFTKSLGNVWIKQEVTFDSDREFQIIFEGLRGVSYKGDIALDDVSFGPGCQRLQPAFVHLRSSNTSKFDTGVVEVYYNDTWGEVCRDGWNDTDSNVTCKELGFQSAANISGVPMDDQFTRGFQSISCRGSERSLHYCSKSIWSNTTTCPYNQTASLQCTGISPVCPLKTHFYCRQKANETAKCISVAQQCDFIKDCWDGSDETNCDNYTRCTFEDVDLCGWLQARNDHMNWTRHSGSTPSIFTGPDADHNGNRTKYYIFMNVAGRSGHDKATIAATPRFRGDHEGLCKVRFFYHMHGWATGALRVVISDTYTSRTIWEKRGAKGYTWHRAEVTLLDILGSFLVMFEAEHSGVYFTGDIAIDDVSFTPECRPAQHENVTCKEGTFKCTSGECISLENRCDFKIDCYDGFDEINCGFEQPGRCDFERDFCDWVNETDDKFDFERESGTTMSYETGPRYDHTLGYGRKGTYIYIEASYPRVYGDKARLAGPQFMWKGIVGCKMRFFYHMWSNQRKYYVGTLKALLRNVITNEVITLWQRTGSQGNRWILADVPIATNWSVAQVVLEATRGHSFQSDIAIDDISFSPQCHPSIPAHVDKNYDVRLVDKKSSYQGRVEVFRVGSWGTVCNDGWDKQDTDVVCRQLGYTGAVDRFIRTLPGQGQIWLDNLRCFGNESNLSMCGHNGWSVHNCDHSKDATATCDIFASTTIPLRLSGYQNDSYRGVVEVFYQGVWGKVCYDGWDLHDAHVACRQVGYLGLQGITKESQGSSDHIWLSKVSCQGNEDSLGKCQHSGWGSARSCSQGFAGVICKRKSASEGDVRLHGGRSPKEGRVEIFHRGEWGTVCEDKWTKEDAQVVCFELGFTSVVSTYQSFGPGSGRVWLNNVQCTGNEPSLTSCRRSQWGINPCTHYEDVGVICGDHGYLGCYKDNDPRVMPHKMSMKDLTPVKCIGYCRSKGYAFMGLEYSTECYCGNHYNKYGNASSKDCASPCVGDLTKTCGGPWRLSVYATDPVIIPSSAPGYLPISQSCSSVTYYGSYAVLNPISRPNYFSGDHKNGYIWSPSFPANYPNKIHCVWVLNLLPGSKASIHFDTFSLEEGYDTFEVRDGKRKYDTRLTPYIGFTGIKARPLTATSNTMWLKFYADQTVSYKGFKLRYEASGLGASTTPYGPTTIDPSSQPLQQKVIGGCNGALHLDNVTFGYYDQERSTGYLKSPGYPGQYSYNLDCDWTIVVRTGFKISATIGTLNLAPGDFLTIGDGHTKQSSRDQPLPWTFVSRDRLVRLSFDSSKKGSRRKRSVRAIGFFLTYNRELFNASTASSSSIFSSTPHTTSLHISSILLASSSTPLLTTVTLQTSVVLTQSSLLVSTIKPSQASSVDTYPKTTTSSFHPTTVLPTSEESKLGSHDKSKASDDKIGGGSIAGIVIGFIVLILIILFLIILLIKNKKKRSTQAGRHCFVNQAYDNTDGMVMTNPAAAPPPAPGLQDPSIFYANVAVAPPPYTPQADNTDPVPGYATPSAPGDHNYTSLYSRPPPYRQTTGNEATTTSIGSVTNLQEAAANNSPLPVQQPKVVVALPPVEGVVSGGESPLVKSVLPAIGAEATQNDQAGPLPEKVPLDRTTADNNNTEPPTRSNLPGPLQGHVTRSPASMQFGVEVPFEFLCPISNNIMKQPVSASDGYTYERRAIKSWFRRNQTSPMTNEKLTDLSLRPNEHLETRLKEFLEAHSNV